MEEHFLAALPNDVLGFWTNAGPKQWYAANARFDAAIRLKFEPVHHAAARGEAASDIGQRQRRHLACQHVELAALAGALRELVGPRIGELDLAEVRRDLRLAVG